MVGPDQEFLAAWLAVQLRFTEAEQLAAVLPVPGRPSNNSMTGLLEEAGALTGKQRELVETIIGGLFEGNHQELTELLEPLHPDQTLPIPSEATLPTPPQRASRDSDGPGEWRVTPEVDDRYEIRDEIGRGGQARVMLAVDS